jgi:hypothetical protein
MDMEERIQTLEDRERIKELMATYCFLVDDDKCAELVNDHFTHDAHCDFRFRPEGLPPLIADLQEEAPPAFISNGREEVVNFFRNFVGLLLKDMSHTTHNHRITVDGDRASGDCYFELTARDANTSVPMTGAGRYFDEFERVDGEWRFSQRKADVFYIAPLNPGW